MSKEFRSIIRITGTNLDGNRKVAFALTGIKGIGIRFASTIVKKAGLNPDTRLGSLSDSEVGKIENILENPVEYDVTGWFVNRQKDKETGRDRHIIGPDLELQTKSDINDMGKMRSWKGIRHSQGLKVRGQRTKTTGRKKRASGIKRR